MINEEWKWPDPPVTLRDIIAAEFRSWGKLLAYNCADSLLAKIEASLPTPQADALNKLALKRVDALMFRCDPAQPGTSEGEELAEWAEAIQAYETARFK